MIKGWRRLGEEGKGGRTRQAVYRGVVDRRLVCGQDAEWTFWVEMWIWWELWAVGNWAVENVQKPVVFSAICTKLRGQPMNLNQPSSGGMETDLVLSNNVSSVFSGVESGGAVPVSGLHYCALSLALFALYPVLRLVMMIRCNCTP